MGWLSLVLGALQRLQHALHMPRHLDGLPYLGVDNFPFFWCWPSIPRFRSASYFMIQYYSWVPPRAPSPLS